METYTELAVLSDADLRKSRITHLYKTRKKIAICIGVVACAFAAKVLYISIGTALYVQPILAAAIIAMILALGLTLVMVHTELKTLLYFDAFIELQRLESRDSST